jgi:hypothetical protein
MAQPNIPGEVVRRISLYCSRGNADKEYVIVVSRDDNGYHVTALYGRRGRLKNGQCKNATPIASLAGAQRVADALITEKTRKGYEIVRDVTPTSSVPPSPASAAMAPPAPALRPRLSAAELDPAARAFLRQLPF